MIRKTDYHDRLETLKCELAKNGLDTFLVTTPDNIYYLTGLTYAQQERPFFLIVRPDGQEKYIVPDLEKNHVKKIVDSSQIITYTEYPATAPNRWHDVLNDCLQGAVLLGVEPGLQIEWYREIEVRDTVITALVEKQRMVKSQAELQLIRECCRYCDQAVNHIFNTAYHGVTELELFIQGRKVQQQILKEATYDPVTTSILVGSWVAPDSAIPHSIPKVDDVLTNGPHIALGYLRVNGYAAENERTFFLSPVTQQVQDAFGCMLQARELALSLVRPGIAAAEIDQAVRELFTQEGYGENILHRTGHGIGIGNHEGPWLAEGSEDVLQENMVISIEPGLYFPDIGGVRHSDTVRVTGDGNEILTSFPIGLEELTITASKSLNKLKGSLMKRMLGM